MGISKTMLSKTKDSLAVSQENEVAKGLHECTRRSQQKHKKDSHNMWKQGLSFPGPQRHGHTGERPAQCHNND